MISHDYMTYHVIMNLMPFVILINTISYLKIFIYVKQFMTIMNNQRQINQQYE